MEQARIPFLSCGLSVYRIVVRVVERIEHGQTVFGLVGVDQVLRRFVEVPTARPHSPTTVQRVRPVGASETGVVLGVLRCLNGKHGFLAVLVFGQEYVAEVLEITVSGVFDNLGIFHHFLHILPVDEADAVGGLVTVAPRNGEIAFCQISCCSYFVGTSSAILHFKRQTVVSLFEFLNHFAHQFLVCELVVANLLMRALFEHSLVNPGHLTEHCNQFEVAVSAQEMNLGLALCRCLFAQFLHTILVKGGEGTVAARDVAVEAIPQLVKFAGSRGQR